MSSMDQVHNHGYEPTATAAQFRGRPRNPEVREAYQHASTEAGQPTTLERPEISLLDGTTAASNAKPRSLLTRVGFFGLAVACLGVLVELALLAFLGYLWAQRPDPGAEPARSETVWRRIVLAEGWMTRTVTLVAVAIRFILGQQAVLCTSLVAALLLEKVSVGSREVAGLSIMRAYNSGPLDVIKLMLPNLAHYARSLPGLLLLLLFAANTVLQFSSTLLVSDFGDINVVSDSVTDAIPVQSNTELFTRRTAEALWQKSLGYYPTFAESASSDSILNDTFSASGEIRRAFLPFDSEQRLRLQSYSGPAIVQTASTECIPASGLKAKFILTYGGADQIALNGSLSTEQQGGTSSSVDFLCPFTYPSNQDSAIPGDSLQMALCNIGQSFRKFLVIKTDASHGDWWFEANSLLVQSKELFGSSSPNGSWADFRSRGEAGLVLSASVCSTKMKHSVATVSMSAPGELKEPSLSVAESSSGWNTKNVISLLGPTRTLDAPKDRGILVLQPEISTIASQPNNSQSDTIKALNNIGGSWKTLETSLLFNTNTDNYQGIPTMHPAHVLVMAAAWNATGNIALSLDTLWVTFAQTVYYQNLGLLFEPESSSSTMSWHVTVSAPLQWTGFIIVATLLVISIIIMILVVAMFAAQTRWSFRSQAWHAVLQILGEQTEELTKTVSGLTDKEVGQLIKERGMDGVMLAVGRNPVTGRVEVLDRGVASGKVDQTQGFSSSIENNIHGDTLADGRSGKLMAG